MQYLLSLQLIPVTSTITLASTFSNASVFSVPLFSHVTDFRWWDCMALPVDVESSEEEAFRAQIRSLAFSVEFMRSYLVI